MVAESNKVIEHRAEQCEGCGSELGDGVSEVMERRQIFDVPPIELEVTEHRKMETVCAQCECKTTGAFPAQVNQPVQYGVWIKGLLVYLHMQQLLQLERSCAVMSDVLGVSPSKGTLVNVIAQCAEQLKPVENQIKDAIIASKVAHFDETGIRIKAK